MRIRCPACRTIHELDVALAPGQKIECSCGHKFFFGEDTLVRAENEMANACPLCGAEIDLTGAAPGAEVRCNHCGTVLELAVEEDETGASHTRLHAPMPLTGANLRAGTVLGRCRIEREVGQGAMGAVYLAQHLTLDIPVAVKVMLPRYGDVAEYKARFYREARTAAKLNHPNVVRVHDCGEENNLLYLVMEYVDGGSVKDLLDVKGRLDIPEVVNIGKAVCHALVEAARHNIVHRDIKPDNIMRTGDGMYKLADLGLAKQISEQSLDAGLTMAAVSMGTPFYMAPEQAVDARSCDARADIYALGATLYHLLCGRPPFTGERTYDIMQQHLTGTCPPPSGLNPAVPPALEHIIGRAMMKKPEDRYDTAADMLTDLTTSFSGITAVPVPAPAPARSFVARLKKLKRRHWIAVGAAVLFLLMIMAGSADKKKRTARGKANDTTGPAASSPGEILPFRVRTFDVVNLVRLKGKPEGFLDVEIELPKRPDNGNSLRAGIRFRRTDYDMDAMQEGRFRAMLGPLPPVKPGEELTVAVRGGDKNTQPRSLTLRVADILKSGPVLESKDVGHDRSPTIDLRWKPLIGRKGIHYRIEIGRFLINGDWQALFTQDAGVDTASTTLERKDLFAKLFGLSPSTPFGIRCIAYKDVRLPKLDVWQRATGITEIPLPKGQGAGWKLDGSADLTAWSNALEDNKLLSGTNPGRCRELYKKHGRKILLPLWRLVLRGEPGAVERFWAAYTLSEVCPRDVAADGFALAIPSALEQRRLMRNLFEDTERTPDAFPGEFKELLHSVQQALRRKTVGRFSRPWSRPFRNTLRPTQSNE